MLVLGQTFGEVEYEYEHEYKYEEALGTTYAWQPETGLMCSMNRRDFVKSLGRYGLTLGSALPALQVLQAFGRKAEAGKHERLVPEEYCEQLSGRRTRCYVCPLNCILKPGETCFCRTRANHNGRLYTHAYGNPCILTVDAVEKLPLSHFRPGTQTLSLAVGGCNLRCLYCQNWRQSQEKPENLRNFDVPPERALEGARKKKLDTIAYTYTDPVAFLEYCLDISTLARERRVRNVVGTALYINPRPLRALCRVTDAFAVALKGFDEKFYEKVLGSELAPVLDALLIVKEEDVWLELVTLIVPSYNDDFDKVREMCLWIRKNLGEDVPLHFGRFVPEYRLKDLPRTPVSTLERCREIGLDVGLKHVYIFNVSPHEGNNTSCQGCGREVITRLGFQILENNAPRGRCRYCQTRLPGVWR